MNSATLTFPESARGARAETSTLRPHFPEQPHGDHAARRADNGKPHHGEGLYTNA